MALRKGSPQPKSQSVSNIKSKLLRPATTSHFQAWLNPPLAVRNFAVQKAGAGIGAAYDADTISLLCSEASIPGSSLATHEINNNFTGVTERHAYRRMYDERADFTFYVDHDYSTLTFFEIWMEYIVNEQVSQGLDSPNYFYRSNFPDGTGSGANAGEGYRSPAIYLNKFEKDYSGRYLQYRFLNAYPISINSMPLSYENSQLLKCTVSFTFTRYLMEYEKFERLATVNPDPNSTPPEARKALSLNDPSELERIRGAAALGSIAGSANGERILNNARSSSARRIVDQSYNRVLYGNPNGQ